MEEAPAGPVGVTLGALPGEPEAEPVELAKVGLDDDVASAPPAATMEQIWVLTLRATAASVFGSVKK